MEKLSLIHILAGDLKILVDGQVDIVAGNRLLLLGHLDNPAHAVHKMCIRDSAYTLEGRALLRLKADIYGKNKTSELTPSQELASANELMKYLCEAKKYNIPDSYTEAEKTKYGIAVDGYTPEQKLQIATIRYGMDANSYKRYVATTVATDVSEETVAAVLENQDSLQGAEVRCV